MKKTIEAEVMDRQFFTAADAEALGWQTHDRQKTPAELAMEHEEGGPSAGADAERREALFNMLTFFLHDFARTADARAVGRRVVSLAKFVEHCSVSGFSATELARACGETPAAMVDRVRRECNRMIEVFGDGVAQARWQQGPGQRQVSARVQMGNRNRVKGRG